jgi:hypothetical protein
MARLRVASMLLSQRRHGPAVRAMRSGAAVMDVRLPSIAPTLSANEGRGPKTSQDHRYSAAIGIVLTPAISCAALPLPTFPDLAHNAALLPPRLPRGSARTFDGGMSNQSGKISKRRQLTERRKYFKRGWAEKKSVQDGIKDGLPFDLPNSDCLSGKPFSSLPGAL